jgi:hypothetical protein
LRRRSTEDAVRTAIGEVFDVAQNPISFRW